MKIAVIVAHPDDEVLGVGGTIKKHIDRGDEVYIFIMCEGKSSRYDSYESFLKANECVTEEETFNALRNIGIMPSQIKFFNLPNNRLDGVQLLDIVKILEKQVAPYKPDIIYTHYYNDLNIDHQLVARAVVTQFRALPDSYVKEIIYFETLSSTESACCIGNSFCPNLFVDITEQLDMKLAALSCYKSELRDAPHPRRENCVRMQAILQGAKVGVYAAEAFMIARIMR